jgi:hypothetical protein
MMKAYQCNNCKNFLDDNVADKGFCRFGIWKDAKECHKQFIPIVPNEKELFMERGFGNYEQKLKNLIGRDDKQ